MKILIIMVSDTMCKSFLPNISIFASYMNSLKEKHTIDYAGISSNDDFLNYKDYITFKYTMINPNKQVTKLSNFITTYKSSLDYDWFIKTRPEVKLLEQLNMDSLLSNSINARARIYHGPRNIPYGISVGGIGLWNHHKDYDYSVVERDIVADDQIFIFDTNVLNSLDNTNFITKRTVQNEWYHTEFWNSKNININIIGINMSFDRCRNDYAKSGSINHHL